MFGIGYVTAEDRTLLMDQIRGPGRIAALDAPGIDPFAITQLNPFFPSPADRGLPRFAGAGAAGPRAGRPAGDRPTSTTTSTASTLAHVAQRVRPLWTRNDVIAVAALFGARVRQGRRRRGPALGAPVGAQDRLGKGKGHRSGTTCASRTTPRLPSRSTASSAQRTRRRTSRATRSSTPTASTNAAASDVGRGAGEPAGGQQRDPRRQVSARRPATRSSWPARRSGTSYPGLLYEVDAHGGGIDARGVVVPGLRARTSSSVAARTTRGARPPRAATTSTSSSRRSAATTRTTCFDGECREMTTFDAGTLGLLGRPGGRSTRPCTVP